MTLAFFALPSTHESYIRHQSTISRTGMEMSSNDILVGIHGKFGFCISRLNLSHDMQLDR